MKYWRTTKSSPSTRPVPTRKATVPVPPDSPVVSVSRKTASPTPSRSRPSGPCSRVRSGTAVTEEILQEVVSGIIEVSDLIDEVSTTVDEQARSVAEVNTAVGQMDTVTQANAASAEESASAAEEMSAQAGEMNSLVQDLVRIVGSASTQNAPLVSPPSGGFKAKVPGFKKNAAKAPARAKDPVDYAIDEVIPLDDDSLIEV